MSKDGQLNLRGRTPVVSSGKTVSIDGPQPTHEHKTNTLKGMLMMAACCAAPFLLLAAVAFLAATFGSMAAVGNGLLSVVALLACPVGMYMMMRMMKDKKEIRSSCSLMKTKEKETAK